MYQMWVYWYLNLHLKNFLSVFLIITWYIGDSLTSDLDVRPSGFSWLPDGCEVAHLVTPRASWGITFCRLSVVSEMLDQQTSSRTVRHQNGAAWADYSAANSAV